ncbi:glycosyltransferase family 9 protein [Glaciecola petra]|uniref:Glycosyltransferase family 9 protein n=1 Tax=Glaciecola petra TaxID=3075602 RepID=A0ABU2ZV10_9ALTE|nr:glycosyltransferase family 9 protein [Aestuariibacter sp. P117]MDT0596440.1 glycosyltransferase family 9 protein [Aestuariibacter sp. P117]
MASVKAECFKLCILRLSAIGDVCHAVAMLSAILEQKTKQKQDIAITWVIGKVEHQLVKHLSHDIPNLRFVVYDKSAGKAAKKAVKDALADTEFDALFVMQVALRANLLSRVIKAKKRIGFDKARSKEGHSLFIDTRIKPRQHAHVLEGFMGFAETIGVDIDSILNDKPFWHMPLLQDDLNWLKEELAQANIEKYVVISPAASKAERNWSPEGYAKVVEYIQQKGLRVVLCGGPGPLDLEISQAIVKLTKQVDLNLVGKTTLTQMLAVLNKAQVVIAPDTGPAHMATTQGTPVVGLYAHSNPRRTGPYLSIEQTVSVYDQLVIEQFGKPWQALPWGKRVKGDALMQKISTQAVIDKLNQVI